MFFYIAVLIISVACSVITIKTVVGYSVMATHYKLLVSILIVAGWFAPLYIGFLQKFSHLNPSLFSIISFVGYSLFGFVFIFFVLLLLRDLFWYTGYGLAKFSGHSSWSINPKNISLLDRANFATFILAAMVALWSIYSGTKIPNLREITIYTPLVTKNYTLVQLTDLHVTRATPLWRVRKVVDLINSLQPDIVLMTGDIIDDRMTAINRQIDELGRLNAPYGIYSAMGNHEYYNSVTAWDYKFRELGFKRLFNRGEMVRDTNIFISGIPDFTTAQSHPAFNINFEKALKGSSRHNFRILLSHNPQVVDNLTSANYNLQLSGHTHGGQIFPFHLLVKKANRYLAGAYKVNGIDLNVSRGAGTWGPSMRLFAPSDITVINLRPLESENKF